MYTLTCRVEFDAAHRLLGYEGPCANLHGHRYVVEVVVEGTELDELGMLIDFGDLQYKLEGFIDKYWDHAVIFNQDDVGMSDALVACNSDKAYRLLGNPTAENMARHLYQKVFERLPANVKPKLIRLFETPDSWVEYSE